jgi:hypothetical protein
MSPLDLQSFATPTSVYDLLKDFQELIVGTVGFLGVILTLYYNGRLTRDQQHEAERANRAQHEREARLSREQHDRTVRHERELITRALLAELRRNRESLTDNLLKAKEGYEGGVIAMPRRTLSEIFDKLFDRIAHLSEDDLRDVLQAYSTIKAVPERILFAQSIELSWNEFDGLSNNDNFIGVASRFVDIYITLMENALAAVNSAIATLEANTVSSYEVT